MTSEAKQNLPGRGVVEGADVSACDVVNSRPPKVAQ
jgi:hypothetical protein